MAAEYGRVQFVKLLLEFGADANDDMPGITRTVSASSDGCLPIHHAASKGFEAVVRALVNGGADATRGNTRGETAVDVARGKAPGMAKTTRLHHSATCGTMV